MKRIAGAPLVASMLLAAASAQAGAPRRTAFLESDGAQLRWDNIEGPPLWVDGAAPRYSDTVKLHLVWLLPGKSVTVALAPSTLLRVHCPGARIVPEDVAAWISDGSGLESPASPVDSSDMTSLVFHSGSLKTMLVKLERPAASTEAISVALFVSRLDSRPRTAGFRDLIAMPGDPATIRTPGWLEGESYWRGLGRPLAMLLKGPADFVLETRLRYPPTESEQLQGYEVGVWIDARKQTFQLATSPDMSAQFSVDGEPAALGGQRNICFSLAEGAHELRIECPDFVYSKLLRRFPGDFLLDAPPPAAPPTAPLDARAIELLQSGELGETRLLGAMRIRQAAIGLAAHPDDRALAFAFYRRHTQWRSLLPAEKRTRGAITVGWFATGRLLDPDESQHETFIAEQHFADAIKGFVLGEFFEAPASRGMAHVYELPPRRSPAILRIAALKNGTAKNGTAYNGTARLPPAAEWSVQLDGGRPFIVRASREPDLPPEAFQQSPAEATLAQAGPSTPLDVPSPIVKAATAEIPLPPDVRVVRLWTATPESSPPVALEYLCDAAPGMTELEYLEITRRAGAAASGGNVILACWKRWNRGEPPLEPAWAELSSRSLPLFRFLTQAATRFQAGAVRPEPLSGGTRRLETLLASRDGVAAARQLAEKGEWLPALEAWSAEIAAGDPDTYALARLERVAALEALGEHFLAERQLRGMFLFEPDASLRSEALERLVPMYQRRGDPDSLLGALATAVLESGDLALVRMLAEAAADGGEHEMALLLATSLPEKERPFPLIARCALKKSWWRVFDAAVGQITNPQAREYWRGIEDAKRGHLAEALRRLDAGGADGAEIARSLRLSVAIRDAMDAEAREGKGPGSLMAARAVPPRSGSPPPSADVVRAWSEWRVSHPGPLEWNDDPSLVIDSAGGVLAYNPARDLFRQYHRALPSRPLKVRVAGPIVLRVEARPLHPVDSALPMDGWIVLREPGWLYPVAVCGNLPAQGLTLVGGDGRLPGAKVVEDVPLGPGLHEIEISSPAMGLLARVLVEEPEISLQVLPLRIPASWAPARGTVGSAYAALADRRLADAMRTAAPGAGENDDRSIRRRMTLFVYAAEEEPCLRGEARVLGDELYAVQAAVPGLQPLHLRLMDSTQWKRLSSVRSSAGIRMVDVPGWQPESPDLRVRKALLARFDETERLITTGSVVVVSVTNRKPAVFQVDLSLESLEYLPRFPVTAVIQLDAGDALKVELSPDAPLPYPLGSGPAVPVRLSVPEGEHTLRLWIDEPIVNHFVRVRVRELKDDEAYDADRGEDLPSTSSRTYFVATPVKPLRLAVEGPTSLQVDELRDGRTITRWRRLSAGWQEVALAPEEGRTDALFRVFERVEGGGREPSPTPAVADEGEAPSAQVPREGGPIEPGRLVLEDTYPLGGQEDGTISLEALLVRRRAFQEHNDTGDHTESYLQIGAGHHYFSEPWSTYFGTVLLGRAHAKSGPLFGAEEEVHTQPEWLPCTLHVSGSAYAQWPQGSAFVPEGLLEWSAYLRGALSRRWPIGMKAYHVPSLSVFVRCMSLNKLGSFDATDLDQDIFTPYKAQHKAGLMASETVGYRPWLDTEWWGRAAITSNTELNPGDPDHLSASAGWKQFVDGWELDAEYLYTRFFNDSDRRHVVERHSVSLLVLRDFWCTPRDRLAISAEIRHDFPDDLNTGFVSLTWYFSGGRGYRDFWPADVDFLDLKRDRVPASYNNEILEAPRD